LAVSVLPKPDSSAVFEPKEDNMSTKSRDKDSMKIGSLKGDDLGLIRGIGPARRQWLRERLHIETVADLAAASADEIYTRLKEEQIVSLSKIESWIEQAKEIIESGIYTSKLKVQENGWKPFASFVVEFQEEVATGHRQTKAHYIEGDKTIKWPDVEHEALCGWFVEQLGINVHSGTLHPVEDSIIQMDQQLFSDNLQAILAKITTDSTQNHQQPLIQNPLHGSTQDQLSSAIPKSVSSEENPHSSQLSGFSEQLQEVLSRTQKFRSKTN